ncbi:MAG: acetoacetate--CoA ligase [Pseudohongiellaceae bacterium]
MSHTQNARTILWSPPVSRLQGSRMQAFLEHINTVHDASLTDYASLHRWSITHREYFWSECLAFTGVQLDTGPDRTLDKGEHPWQDRWFPGARLNYARNLLCRQDDHTALLFRDETGIQQSVTYAVLHAEVTRLVAWLREQGVTPGDRVAAFAANRPETVVAMLATASVGAVWSSCSPDFGVNGVLDRLTQIEPVILFAVSSHCYAGRINRHAKTLERLQAALPSVKRLVLLPELYGDTPSPGIRNSIHWHDATPRNPVPLQFAAMQFNDPLFIMYSSGTTGKPKCIIHGVGGTLLQHRKEHELHADLTNSSVLFYFTTCGWMMWNWLVSGLASGATLVLYDGSPFHPAPDSLFDLIDETGITHFGVSAKFIATAQKQGLAPRRTHSLGSLQTILSTGSPLLPEHFDHVYEHIHPDVALQSISGGTDIISCFVLGCPLLPVRRGEIQCAGLGMDVAVLNEAGEAVIGERGELVCRQSFPSMPTGFWNDPDGKRYRQAYFDRFPDIWTHGDYAEQRPKGGFVILGRSDTVLNPGGVRIGTAEIYRQVEPLPEVAEAVAVGLPERGDVRIALCIRLTEGYSLDDGLRDRIRQAVRDGASPRHVPRDIFAVSDIPRTLSGKIAELAVRSALLGEDITNRDALANPEALDEYRAMA